MGLEYRGCTVEDFEKLISLFSQLSPALQLREKDFKKVYRRALGSKSHHYLCAESKDKIVGFCSMILKNSLRHQEYLGHIEELVIDHSMKSKEVRIGLIERMIEASKVLGCKRVELHLIHDMDDYYDLYKDVGFKKKGELFLRELF